MKINGRVLKWNDVSTSHNREHVPVLRTAVRQVLSSMKFVQGYVFEYSSCSDSMYLTLTFKGLNEKCTLSIRSHYAREELNTYVYFNVPHYDTLEDLQKDIDVRVTEVYNKLEKKQQEINLTRPCKVKPTSKHRTYAKKAKNNTKSQTSAKYAVARASEHAFNKFIEEFNASRKQAQEEQYC